MGRAQLVAVSAVALAMVGCAAGQVQTATVAMPPPPDASTYESALVEALDNWQADVEAAAHAWYPTYTDAYATAQDFIRPDLTVYVDDALAQRGLTMDQLNTFAATHPDFVQKQNRLYEARILDSRPAAFAIMGRIDGTLDDHNEGEPTAPDTTQAIASAAVPNLR